ncbi:helix-turn-helix domain-containing protein [Acinetobacter haemolyticus]|uniref:helix-turn-helix domain-containing protein n=1 Tax=Acinetobacter haemolyticus TaxID=29430 RepID=UPI001372DEEB|nr:helix-turn-helix transcriptional regulator [Acinetobacter haemolyticus]NAR30837.1 helix-turn-helix domain-containing protein [Acinetobacter haemolyticus]
MTKSIHTDEMSTLLDWLKSQRKAQKLTMHNLAARMDHKSHSYVQKIEQGERRLDVIEYLWYCTALGVDPHAGVDFVLKNSSPSTKSPSQE